MGFEPLASGDAGVSAADAAKVGLPSRHPCLQHFSMSTEGEAQEVDRGPVVCFAEL